MARSGGSFALPRPGWRAIIAGALAVVVIGVIVAARLGDSGVPRPAAAPKNAGAVSPSIVPSPSASPLPDDGAAEQPPGRQVPRAALTVAADFVAAWAHHPDGVDPAVWWRRVAPYTDAVLREQLRSTDPGRVPATKVTGPPRGVSGGVTSATIAVPTDAGTVVLTCVLVDGAWLVSDLDVDREEP